jgi:hypothetical protein
VCDSAAYNFLSSQLGLRGSGVDDLRVNDMYLYLRRSIGLFPKCCLNGNNFNEGVSCFVRRHLYGWTVLPTKGSTQQSQTLPKLQDRLTSCTTLVLGATNRSLARPFARRIPCLFFNELDLLEGCCGGGQRGAVKAYSGYRVPFQSPS